MKYFINGDLVCTVLQFSDWAEGLNFLTADSDFVQVATWWYNSEKSLDRHYHKRVKRVSDLTQEVLVVLQGRVEVDLYSSELIKEHSFILNERDISIFLGSGHGYRILDDNTRIVEMKNGPFLGLKLDKQRF